MRPMFASLGLLALLLGGCQSVQDLHARPAEYAFHIAAPYKTVKLNVETTMYECFDVYVSPLVRYTVETEETVPGAAATISFSAASAVYAVDVKAAADGTNVYYYETKYAVISRDEKVVRNWALGTGRCDANKAASPIKSKKVTALPETTEITPL